MQIWQIFNSIQFIATLIFNVIKTGSIVILKKHLFLSLWSNCLIILSNGPYSQLSLIYISYIFNRQRNHFERDNSILWRVFVSLVFMAWEIVLSSFLVTYMNYNMHLLLVIIKIVRRRKKPLPPFFWRKKVK